MDETNLEDPPATERDTPWSGPVLAAATATVVALLVGLRHLGRVGFWYDEGQTVGTVDRPVGDALWRIVHWEVNQSPFHLLATAWIRLGESEAFLRLLALGFWVATVPLLFLLGRRLVDERVGAIAAVAYALHGFALEWGQQFRGYTMAAFFTTLATLALARLLEAPTTRRGVIYGIVAALAAYSHFFAILVLGAHAVTALVAGHRMPRRPFVVAGLVGGVLLAPLGWFLLTAENDPISWVGEGSRSQVLDVVTDLAGGGTLPLIAYAAAGALGLLALRRSVVTRGWTESWPILLIGLWVVMPLAIAVVATATVKPLLVARFLLVIVPGLALLAAVGIADLADRGRRAGAAAVLAGLLVASAVGVTQTWGRPTLEDWRGAVAYVADNAAPGDVVVVVPSLAVHPVRYYLERSGADGVELDSPDDVGEIEADRVWVISRDRPDGRRDGPALVALRLEDVQLEQAGSRQFANVLVQRYERP